jgi:transmembrane sensor
MNTSNSRPKLNKQIYEEGAEWLVELRVGYVDAATRERLDAWFRESPHHIRAFLELSSIWEDGGDPDLDRAHTTEALIARARAATNVIPLERHAETPVRPSVAGKPTTQSRSGKPESLVTRSSWRSLLAASVASACMVGGGLGFWFWRNWEPIYSTRVGEEKSIQLTDGSTLELNSRSRIRVRFSAHEREVDLVEGQALFHVAKDAARPFIVHSDAAQIRAVGTQFDVYRKASGTTVTVVEGRVAVLPTAHDAASAVRPQNQSPPEAQLTGGAGAVILAAGEQLTVAPLAAAAKPTKADVTAATAWTQHQLVFDSTPLSDVAQEFNRYNVRQLIVNDAGLTDFHVTGVFSSTDPSSLLRFLRAQRGISVEETDREIRISQQ